MHGEPASPVPGSLTWAMEVWEDDGGAAPRMTGTPAQVEWAERIKCRVNQRFDRVSAAFRLVAAGQGETRHGDTEAILEILEDKRAEVMNRNQAGYFIHGWQEINDQIRQLIFHDERYQTIRSKRKAH